MHWLVLLSLALVATGLSAPAAEVNARDIRAPQERRPTAEVRVRDHGAAGDGQTLDTRAINQAIAACAQAGGGRVVFNPGTYLSGTVHLRSGVTLFLEAGATLAGTTNLDLYESFTLTNTHPRLPVSRWHRGLILAEGAENIGIAGRGVIDGRHVFDPRGEERMRGPHAILLGGCRHFVIQDITVSNAANYALLFLFTDEVEARNATFAGGWDGIHFRGSPERYCEGVRITGCRFFTGDDCIAGSYWRHVVISDCIINSSCNGVRLIGPALDSTITRCQVFGPGRHEHRTSRDRHRTNMLAGICLQPSAWEPMPGPLENIRISDLVIQNVTTPFHIVLREGNTAGRIEIERVTATGAYRTACSVESWGSTGFSNVVFRNVSMEFTGGGTAEEARLNIGRPGVDARPLPAWGFYARHVQNLRLEQVSLTCARDDARPMFIGDDIGRLDLSGFRCSRPAAARALMVLNDVRQVGLHETDLPVVKPRGRALSFLGETEGAPLRAGRLCSARVQVENGDREGLTEIELQMDGHKETRWVWLRANERKEVLFQGLTAPAAGTHTVLCAGLEQKVEIQP
jgi:hypothetical protein